jgi:hypothetical protein
MLKLVLITLGSTVNSPLEGDDAHAAAAESNNTTPIIPFVIGASVCERLVHFSNRTLRDPARRPDATNTAHAYAGPARIRN